jgi:hypothetical protein
MVYHAEQFFFNFFFGSACAAAMVKTSFLINYGKTGDFLWDSTNLTIWTV